MALSIPKSIQLSAARWEELRHALMGRHEHHGYRVGLKAIAAACEIKYQTLYQFVNAESPERGLLVDTLWRLARRCPVDSARVIASRCLRDGAPGFGDLEDFRPTLVGPLQYARTNYSWALSEAVFSGNKMPRNLVAASADILWGSICGEYFAQCDNSLAADGAIPIDQRFDTDPIKDWVTTTEGKFSDSEDDFVLQTDWHFELWRSPWHAHWRQTESDERPSTPEAFEKVLELVENAVNGKMERPLVRLPAELGLLANAAMTEDKIVVPEESRPLARVKLMAHSASISRRAVMALSTLLYGERVEGIENVDAVSEVWRMMAAVEALRWPARWRQLQRAYANFKTTASPSERFVWTEIEEEFLLTEEEVSERHYARTAAAIQAIDWSFIETGAFTRRKPG